MNANVGSYPRAVALTGIYMLLAGLFLFAHFYYPAFDADMKHRLFNRVENRFAELQDSLKHKGFADQSSHALFYESYDGLRQAMQDFRSQHLEGRPVLALAVAGTGILTGMVYILAGVLLLKRSVWTGKSVVAAFSLWTIYLGIYMVNAFMEIQFMDYSSLELWQMASFFKPHVQCLKYRPLVKSLFNFSVTRAALFAAVWVIFFLILPLYGLLRPSVRGLWQRK